MSLPNGPPEPILIPVVLTFASYIGGQNYALQGIPTDL
jgi:hypothetical protein